MSVENDLLGQSAVSQDRSSLAEARAILRSVSWMLPLSKFAYKASSAFGRNIESSLAEVVKNKEVVRLQLDQKDTAVVISVDHYSEMLQLKNQYENLVKHIQEKQLKDAVSEYDQLYTRLTSAKSQKAADDLFAAGPDDLRRTYKPGLTETP